MIASFVYPQRWPLQGRPLKTENVSLTMHDFIMKELINQAMEYSEAEQLWQALQTKTSR